MQNCKINGGNNSKKNQEAEVDAKQKAVQLKLEETRWNGNGNESTNQATQSQTARHSTK